MKSTYQSIVSFLQNPFVIISSVVLGLFIGFYSPFMGGALEPYGNAFMALLEMSLLPIIISAVALSVSNLLCIKNDDVHSSKMVLIILSITVLVSAVSCFLAYIFDPAAGFLGSGNLKIKEITTSAAFLDRELNVSIVESVDGGLSHFLVSSVPKNIFHALAQGNMLQIIIFSIIFGVAISYLIKSERLKVQAFCNTTLTIFQKIIMSITVWLPLAIVCLMAGGASAIGIDIMLQMGGFILKIYAVFSVIFIASTWVIKKRVNCSFMEVLRALKDPIIIAFGTRSAILPIPSILDAFENKIPINQSIAKLLVPLGAVLGRFGNISYFAFLSIFIAGVYQTEITLSYFAVIILLSTLAGLSTAGATGILTLSALTIVLNPLQLPLGAILPILIAVDAIVDPMRTLISVYTNCAAVAFISPKQNPKVKEQLKTAPVT
ncbi:MAG: dicarboxylate/amino acid:cation symporter [Alphaproteobacteria bacterium]|nr:dicarboxylate/amino acid:cation symporter [Alphaproteobacteria bacterium]NCQ66716.1 dicarboxylate/amino acid:cation symporter [Alphaproteobacteria bacterium]NCT07167.1 dicarboxylate/amino acid:cation symporter [Alphaproteobacteria bacterium]